MASNNSKPGENLLLLFISLLVTVGLLVQIWAWLHPRLALQAQTDRTLSSFPSPSEPLSSQLSHRFSTGERQLIEAVTTLAKQEGIVAFAKRDYQKAANWFEESLRLIPNDPETLVYLNNARVRAMGTKSYAIATSIPIGKALNVAQEILRGVAQAQDEINRNGGIDGIGLEIEIVNDDNDPTLTPQIAQVLGSDTNILAVIGHNTSDASLGAASIYQEWGMVMISPTTFDPAVSRVGNYIFRAVPTAQSMSAVLVKHVIEQLSQPARMLICYDSAAPDNAVFRDAFVDTLIANGGEVVNVMDAQGNDRCNFASPTFSAEEAIAQAQAKGANSLYLGPSINYLDPAIAVARANAGRLPLFSSPSLYTQKITQDGQQAVAGLVLVAPWNPGDYPTFARRAQGLWRATVNWRTATAYDATRAIIDGLQQNQTRSGLQHALQNPAFSTAGSGELIRFLDTRDRRLTSVLIQVRSDGSGGYHFVSLAPHDQ